MVVLQVGEVMSEVKSCKLKMTMADAERLSSVAKTNKKVAVLNGLCGIRTTHENKKMVLEYRLKARKLARSILKKWHSRLDDDELHSVVDLSLCEAVSRFDPAKGACFITFLFYHLRGNLIRSISGAANGNIISILNNEEERFYNSSKYGGALGVIDAIDAVESLSGKENETPDQILLKKELVKVSTSVCKKLDKLEQEVIFQLYIQGRRLIDIAVSLGYSRCHISRVKRKALETLQREMCLIFQENFKPLEGEDDSDILECRQIHRRKPRSQKILQVRAARSAAVQAQAAA